MKPTLVPVTPGFVARVRGFIGRPLGRGVLALGGLVVLSLVGRFAAARGQVPLAAVESATTAAAVSVSASAPVSVAVAAAVPDPVAVADAGPAHARRATADDPVYLNEATVDDLRRLPGIGPKRALAVLDLRKRLGRFRQIEDLLRVRGIGRSTLRKLRPLVRLDHPAAGDGGAP